MNQRSSLLAWVFSLLLLLVSGGSSWANAVLVPDAGSQVISISGFSAFSVASALALLQGAAILATLLTNPLVGRIISGSLIPLLTWHLIDVVISRQGAVESAISQRISDLTGVSGALSQQDLVVSLSESPWWILYLVAILINIVILGLRAAISLPVSKPREILSREEDSIELWESQKPS